jgi:hypothetical protein
MQRILVILAITAFSNLAYSACIDVVDLAVELPAQYATSGNVLISYQYDLTDDQYFLSLRRGNSQSELFGPFPLTMACGTAEVRWENDQFLVLERGCGTFFWYAKIFQFPDRSSIDAPAYQRIERPLAFDSQNKLLAYYHSQNLIRIKNLVTGVEQEIRTQYDCEYYSGLCFGDVQIEGGELSYTWHEGQGGERISVELESFTARFR